MDAEVNNRGKSSSHQEIQSINTSRKGLLTSEGKEIKNRDKNLLDPRSCLVWAHGCDSGTLSHSHKSQGQVRWRNQQADQTSLCEDDPTDPSITPILKGMFTLRCYQSSFTEARRKEKNN